MTAIYVAGSSDELARAELAMDRVRGIGWRITLDWTATIRGAGGIANPFDAPRSKRRGWAELALQGVEDADAVWLLAPEVGHGRGAFVELGFALAIGIPVLVSGPTYACSIFTAMAHAEMVNDDDGWKLLQRWFKTGRAEAHLPVGA